MSGLAVVLNSHLRAAIAVAILAWPAHAATPQPETYGDWTVRGSEDGAFTASTATQAGSLFGLVCDRTKCDAFFNPKILCEDGRQYPALIISRKFAFATKLRCTKIGELHAFIIPLEDGLTDVITGGGEFGIAFPLESGQFGEARFSLKGAGQASTRARERAGTDLSVRPA